MKNNDGVPEGWAVPDDLAKRVSKVLNQPEIKSKRGDSWYPSTVNAILKNEEKYRGGVRGYSPIYWPQILEE